MVREDIQIKDEEDTQILDNEEEYQEICDYIEIWIQIVSKLEKLLTLQISCHHIEKIIWLFIFRYISMFMFHI